MGVWGAGFREGKQGLGTISSGKILNLSAKWEACTSFRRIGFQNRWSIRLSLAVDSKRMNTFNANTLCRPARLQGSDGACAHTPSSPYGDECPNLQG
ncbi:MAG TPA: hypothetical protein VMN36_10140 [Verrucomicrobiales bacterium]|nr:hypothetical protein [Verrucomicrobiales bacterium]